MIVGICGDDGNLIRQIDKICHEKLSHGYRFAAFRNGRELLDCPEEIDLLFLDIEMSDIDGIEIKNRLMRMERKTIIIFITDHFELMKEAVGINVMGFVSRDEIEVKLPVMLKEVEDLVYRNFTLNNGISSHDIFYIRAAHNYGELALRDGSKKLIRKSMKELEGNLLQYGFIRIHRQYLVNMKWIEKFQIDTLCVGGDVLPVSTRLRRNVASRYQNFCGRNVR